MIGDHVKLTQKCVSPRFFFSRFSEGLITFQNLLNRSTVASLQTSQVAYEQALRVALAAGREKKGELARLWNLILHRKSRCEMLIGGDDISNDVITLGTCFSMFVYIRARFCFALIGGNLTAQSTGSHRGIGGGIQIPET